jgi:DNA helicase-2/ATP-dependent DNA helicase PcrA
MDNKETQTIVAAEQQILDACLVRIDQQIEHTAHRFRIEEQRSRDMTSEIYATRRAEDKALLASDERVAHALRDQQHLSLESLEKQKDKPYFARMVLLEETPQGNKEIEYRLGQYSNSDCRIVDWRHAPVSKIYYEYMEGEEYAEEIQGRERLGTIKFRNSVDIAKGQLRSIKTRGVTLRKTENGWESGGASENLRTDQGESYQALPSILPLITPDQYALITSSPETSIIIQGIAGSGKTTVALHRLSWLLHQKDNQLNRANVAIITRSELLKSYIQNSTQKLEIADLPVLTYNDWLQKQLKSIKTLENFSISNSVASSSVVRCLGSLAVLLTLEELVAADKSNNLSPETLINNLFSDTNRIVERDQTKLISRELILTAKQHALECIQDSNLTPTVASILIHWQQLRANHFGLDHLFLDEGQDYWPLELKTLVSAVGKNKSITAVGDTSQNIFSSSNETLSSSDWRELLKTWWKQEDNFNFISLNVSHRNSIQIMQLAQHVQKQPLTNRGKPGRPPIWFECGSESDGIPKACDWLTKACNLYPTGIQAVICYDGSEAQQVYKFLQPTFHAGVALASGRFWNDSGIVVLTVKQSKGLEFTNVLLWNPSLQKYPDHELSRNMLYTAITRAESNLCLVTWGKHSPLLPSTNSKLIRFVPRSDD